MSEIASAFVRIRPNMSGFASEMKAGLSSAFKAADDSLSTTTAGTARLSAGFDEVAAKARASMTGVAESAAPVMTAFDEVRAKAQQNVAAFVGQESELRGLVAEYKAVASAAVTGSDQQVAAAKLAADAQQQLKAKIGQTETATLSLSSAVKKVGGVFGIAFGAEIVGKFVEHSVASASQLQKSTEAIKMEMGQAGAAVVDFNQKAGAELGISASTGEAAAAKFAILFKNMNMGQGQAAQMTVGLEKLAGSLAMIRGVDPSAALQSLSMAMLGNMRSLKQLGLAITPHQIALEAQRLGLDKVTKSTAKAQQQDVQLAIAKARLTAAMQRYGAGTTQVAQAQLAVSKITEKMNANVAASTATLTPAEKAMAIYSLATKNLGLFQRQAAAHADDLANVQRRLTAEMSNAREELGTALMPVVTHLTAGLADWLRRLQQTGALQRDVNATVKDAAAVFGLLASVVRTAWTVFQTAAGWIGGTKRALVVLTTAFIAFKAQALLQSVLTSLAQMAAVSTSAGAETAASLRGVQTQAGQTGAVLSELGPDASASASTIDAALGRVSETVAGVNGQLSLFATELSTNLEVAAAEGAAAVETAVGESGIAGAVAAARTQVSGLASSLAAMSGAIIPITIALSMIPANKGGQAALDQVGLGGLGKLPVIGGLATQSAALGNDIRGWLGEGKLPSWTTADADAARAAARQAAKSPRNFIDLSGVKQITTKAQAIKFAMEAAAAEGIDPQTFLRQINQESGFQFGVRSKAGATGIAQFMPGTAKGLGVNPLNPGSSLAGAAVLMKRLTDQYGGNVADALAAYNAGPGAVNAFLAGRAKLPKETVAYVNSILGSASPFATGTTTKTGGPTPASTQAAIDAAAGGLHVGKAAPKPMSAAQVAAAKKSLGDTFGALKARAAELGPQLTAEVTKQMAATSKAITAVASKSDVAAAKADLSKLRADVDTHMKLLRASITQTKAFDAVKAQVDKMGAEVPPDVRAQMKKIQAEIGKAVTPTQIADLQRQMGRVKAEVKKGLDAIKAHISAEKSAFDSMWQQMTSGLDAAFSRATQKGMTDVNALVAAAQKAGLGSDLIGSALGQTPAEQQLAALQGQHQQAQDAKTMADAQQAVADAQKQYDEASAAGVPADVATAKANLLSAQAGLADAQYNAKVSALQAQATLERDAANKQLADAQTAYQDQRALLQQQLDQRVADIQTGMLNGNIAVKTGLDEMTGILNDPAYGNLAVQGGVVIAGNLYAGLQQGLGPVFDMVNSLVTGMKEVGLLPQSAPSVTAPAPAGGTDAVARYLANHSGLLANILAELQKQTPATQKTAENTDPSNTATYTAPGSTPAPDANAIVAGAAR